MSFQLDLHLTLPSWLQGEVDRHRVYSTHIDKMTLAIALAQRNVEAETGGPFGAAIFAPDDRLIAVGVNRVIPQTCSVAHAETMACMLAQRTLGRVRLNRDAADQPWGPVTLAASGQPCSQCYGALVWAGIDRLLIGASSEDIEELTEFDEGPLPEDWAGELEMREIEVVRDVLRDDACEVLRAYALGGGERY